MIIVIANVFIKDGGQDEFLSAAKECISATLKEDGNLSYDLKVDPFNKCSYTFVETWKSSEALDLHMKSSHFGTFGSSINALLTKDLEVNIYNSEKIN